MIGTIGRFGQCWTAPAYLVVQTVGPFCSRLWNEVTFVDFDHGLNAAVNKLREVLGERASYLAVIKA